jgi:hypothetical protein
VSKPDHLGIEYDRPRWQPLWSIGSLEYDDAGGRLDIIKINGVVVGTLEPRPSYCDRGRWMFRCDLPDLDHADGFPRYYMDLERAKDEIVAWFAWRLWRRR